MGFQKSTYWAKMDDPSAVSPPLMSRARIFALMVLSGSYHNFI